MVVSSLPRSLAMLIVVLLVATACGATADFVGPPAVEPTSEPVNAGSDTSPGEDARGRTDQEADQNSGSPIDAVLSAVERVIDEGSGSYRTDYVITASAFGEDIEINSIKEGSFTDQATAGKGEFRVELGGTADFSDTELTEFTDFRLEFVVVDGAIFMGFEDEGWLRVPFESILGGATLPSGFSPAPVPFLEALGALALDTPVSSLPERERDGQAEAGYVVTAPLLDLALDLFASGAALELAENSEEHAARTIEVVVWVRNGALSEVEVDMTAAMQELVPLIGDGGAEAFEMLEVADSFSAVSTTRFTDLGSVVTVQAPEDWTALSDTGTGNEVLLYDVQADTCLDLEDIEAFFAPGFETVPCSAVHRYEVYSRIAATEFSDLSDPELTDDEAEQLCRDLFFDRYGFSVSESALDVYWFVPDPLKGSFCIAGAPEPLSGELNQVAPFTTPAGITVDVVPLATSDDARFQQALFIAVDDGTVVIVGPDDADDPDLASGDNDHAVWVSDTNGVDYTRITDAAFVALDGNQWASQLLSLDRGFAFLDGRAIWTSDATGFEWEASTPVPEDDSVDVWIDIIAVTDGVLVALGSALDPETDTWIAFSYRSTDRGATWSESSLIADDLDAWPDTAQVTPEGTLAIRLIGSDAESAPWFESSDDAQTWDPVLEPARRSELDSLLEGSVRVAGFEGIEYRIDDGDWIESTVASHDNAIVDVWHIATHPSGNYLAAGQLFTNAGKAAAMWLSIDGGATFDLIYLAGPGERSVAVTAIATDEGFAVAGWSDPSQSFGSANNAQAWLVQLDG